MVDFIEVVASEWAAARRVKGLQGRHRPWPDLIALAQTELARWEAILEEDSHAILRNQTVGRVISATRILDLASQAGEDHQRAPRLDLAILATLAYALHGNFPAAGAVTERMKAQLDLEQLSPIYIAAIASASPRHIGELLRLDQVDGPVRNYLEIAASVIEGAEQGSEAVLESGAALLAQCRSAFEMSLVGLATAALATMQFLNMSRAVRAFGLDEEYVESLNRAGVTTLMPPQLYAIRGGIMTDDDVVVALPTSTGKTLIGELCLMKSLGLQPGLAVYLTPYVALGSQVRDGFRRHLPRDVRVHGLFGGYQSDTPLDPSETREVVVATPERFDALLRNTPQLHEYLRCVVVDEAHHLGDSGRGLLVESLLARLKLVRRRNDRRAPRMVMMSAVISNTRDVAHWLGGEATTITASWRPAAQRIGVWTERGRIIWYPGRDIVTESVGREHEVLGLQELPWPRTGFRPTRHYGAQQRQRQLMAANVAYLTRYLTQRYDSSVLCVCATRATSRAVAAEAAELFEELEPLPDDVLRAVELIEQRHHHLRPLANLLRRGVAYHNASLPVPVRSAIETAARSEALRLVAATTTLAEGVDLPFRYTVVADWLMWGDWGQEQMSPLLFSNIAGRSGRAGMHTEGETILVDNPVGNPGMVAPGPRAAALRRILGLEEEPKLTSALSDDRALDIDVNRAVLASQFLAAIPENPRDPSVGESLSGAMFNVVSGTPSVDITDFMEEVEADVLDDSDGALAAAASPLALTDLGAIALKTGLSPNSFRRLFAHVRQVEGSPFEDVVRAAADLLRATWRFPEQPNRELRKSLEEGRRSGIYVHDEDLELLLAGWLSGDDYIEMFTVLPGVMRSQRQDRLDNWLEGESPRSSWYDIFEKFTSFVDEVFGSFLPWMCRAAGVTSEGLDLDRPTDWSEIAVLLESGVDTLWAANVLQRGGPSSRSILAEVGRRITAATELLIPEVGLGEEALVGVEIESVIAELRDELTDQSSLRDLQALEDWLRGR